MSKPTSGSNCGPEKVAPSRAVLAPLEALLPEAEAIYTDIHAHPELSMQEKRTAGIVAERLKAAGLM